MVEILLLFLIVFNNMKECEIMYAFGMARKMSIYLYTYISMGLCKKDVTSMR